MPPHSENGALPDGTAEGWRKKAPGRRLRPRVGAARSGFSFGATSLPQILAGALT
jgi:hypothetical protein